MSDIYSVCVQDHHSFTIGEAVSQRDIVQRAACKVNMSQNPPIRIRHALLCTFTFLSWLFSRSLPLCLSLSHTHTLTCAYITTLSHTNKVGESRGELWCLVMGMCFSLNLIPKSPQLPLTGQTVPAAITVGACTALSTGQGASLAALCPSSITVPDFCALRRSQIQFQFSYRKITSLNLVPFFLCVGGSKWKQDVCHRASEIQHGSNYFVRVAKDYNNHFECVPVLVVLAAGSFTKCFAALCSFFSEYSSVITGRRGSQ